MENNNGMVVQFEVKGKVDTRDIKEVGQGQVTVGQNLELMKVLGKDTAQINETVPTQSAPLGKVLPPVENEATELKDISEFKTKKDLFLYAKDLGISLNDKHTMAKMYEELVAGVNNASK